MQRPSVRFELGGGHWVPERLSVGFIGTTELGEIEFLIASDALGAMLNPDLEVIDRDLALEIFAEFEADIYRIARLEFAKRPGDRPPILLKRADVELR